MTNRRNPPKVQKLEQEQVPLSQLGQSTFGRPIREEHKRIHADMIRRALKRQTPRSA
jgi:hypothetical protein